MADHIAKFNGLLIRSKVGMHQPKAPIKSRPCRAFTLIELLVVIAIIALLMAILVPVLRSARNQARAVVCQANLKQWGTILAIYTEDNQGRLPSNSIPAIWLLRGSYLLDGDPNKPPVYHDFNTEGIACCPMAVRPGSTGGGGTVGAGGWAGTLWRIRYTNGSTFEAWEIISPSPTFRGSYGLNQELFDNHYSIRGKANVPVLLDCPQWRGSHDKFFPGPPPFEGIIMMQSFCIDRHNGHVNGLFLDWSARKIGLKELWTLKWNSEYDTANEWTRAGGVQPEDWLKWMRKFGSSV